MKIAIVTGGFDGIARQKRRWDLERDIERTEERLAAARRRLLRLQEELSRTPTQEIKQ